MQSFGYVKATGTEKALAGFAVNARFIAGGTTLVDLMKLGVEKPSGLVDINLLPLDKIELTPSGGLTIGALVRNSDLAWNATVKEKYAVLSQAILSGASPQLRNMATTGGNLLQRVRCAYFRDPSAGQPGGYGCNKRAPGTGCAAMDGFHRVHAVLGTSEHCIATHPSDMCVAMAALEAVIHVEGPNGKRTIGFADFHKLPGETPQIENALAAGELVTYVELPKPVEGAKSAYLKLRDRASYEFALASAAVVARVEGGRVKYVRVAMGGVGTKPWRSHEAEAALMGKEATAANFRAAAEAAMRHARARRDNAFKVELAKRCVVRTLKMATA
ncbi:FAD binding domain-containing protein [Terracidiphilus sp.]|jgi:xanthine dehydrogenase YagS FAD-binding subunit|uniref:FAD binding domain-containing protein n=1 Tax=Terracidiphilus sp. TaxID=1964191 RepID=UPI003C17B5E1